MYYFGMEELEISGKRYISTRRAAREHGYHSDYMGQLIRGKKVVGQKVGRAWYIEEGSLNAYLGVASEAAQPVMAPAPAETPAQPAPVERLVIEEPIVQPVQPVQQVQPVQEVAPQPVAIQQQVPVRAIYNEPHIPAPVAPAQNISYAAPIQGQEVEQETRIPIHKPAPEAVGGLRYADDDTPSIPVMSRAQQEQYTYVQEMPQPQRSHRNIPYTTLSIIGITAIVVSVFVSNFISATIVTEEGKSATVQYAIHW